MGARAGYHQLQGTEEEEVNIFGTNYNPDEDFVSFPLQRVALSTSVERLTLGVVDNNFRIAWGDAAWVTPIERVAKP